MEGRSGVWMYTKIWSIRICFSMDHQKTHPNSFPWCGPDSNCFQRARQHKPQTCREIEILAPSPDASALKAYGSPRDLAWLFLVLSVHVLTNRMLNECTVNSVSHLMLDAATELHTLWSASACSWQNSNDLNNPNDTSTNLCPASARSKPAVVWLPTDVNIHMLIFVWFRDS